MHLGHRTHRRGEYLTRFWREPLGSDYGYLVLADQTGVPMDRRKRNLATKVATIAAVTCIAATVANTGTASARTTQRVATHTPAQAHRAWCNFSDTLPMTDMSDQQMMDEMDFYPMMKHNLGAKECSKVVVDLVSAKRYGLQFRTAGAAIAAGYHMVAPYVPGQGAHYMGPQGFSSTFDPMIPNFLLFGGNGPNAPLVGLMWLVQSGQQPPTAGLPGGNDHWHRHGMVCMVNGIIMAENISDAACAAMGGVNIDISSLWMLHAWIVPGYEYLPDVFRPHVPFLK